MTGHCFSLIRIFIGLSFPLDAKIITVRPIPPGLMLGVTSRDGNELDLSSSGHFTYSDVPLLAAEVGYLDGFRAFKIVTTYLGAFMDPVLRLSEACLLPYLLTKADVMEKDSRVRS